MLIRLSSWRRIGLDATIFSRIGAFVRAEHEADAGAVDVAIAEADALSFFSPRKAIARLAATVDLPHAALAAGNGDDVFDSLYLRLREGPPASACIALAAGALTSR